MVQSKNCNSSKTKADSTMAKHVFCVLFLFFAQPHLFATEGDSTSNEELLSRILESHANDLERYNDGHFVWLEKTGPWADPVTGLKHESAETRFEYWARHGEYFRLDATTYIGGQQSGVVGRTLACPDKPVRSNWGCTSIACTKAPPDVSDFPVIHAGFRVGTTQLSDYITMWHEGSDRIASLKVDNSDPQNVELEIVEEQPEGTVNYVANVDPRTYVIRSWNREAVTKDGEHIFHQRRELQYDNEIPWLPQRAFDSDAEMEYDISLTSVDLKPASLDVFDVDIPYPESVETSSLQLTYAFTFAALAILLFVVYNKFRSKTECVDSRLP
ncbi:hypothetical protein N9N28_15035 [Rubripirellula amarantea]|nr:hypothetical protein [Rubripirellula amarantea]